MILAYALSGYVFCTNRSHDVNSSERQTIAPSQFIEINSTEMELFSLLYVIVDAFGNPEKYPSIEVQDNSLTYDIFDSDLETDIVETDDYLRLRFIEEFGPPLTYPMYFSNRTDGKVLYYSWEVYSVDVPCR